MQRLKLSKLRHNEDTYFPEHLLACRPFYIQPLPPRAGSRIILVFTVISEHQESALQYSKGSPADEDRTIRSEGLGCPYYGAATRAG